MKDYDGIIIAIFVLAISAALYFGIKTGLKKIINKSPEIQNTDHTQTRDNQRRKTEKMQERQKWMREQQQQRLRDYQRR